MGRELKINNMEPISTNIKRSPLDCAYSPLKQLETSITGSLLSGSNFGFSKGDKRPDQYGEPWSSTDAFRSGGGSGSSINISQDLFKSKYGDHTFSVDASGSMYKGKDSKKYSDRRATDIDVMSGSRYGALFTQGERDIASSNISGDPNISTLSAGGKYTYTIPSGLLGESFSSPGMKVSLGGGATWSKTGEHLDRGTTKFRETQYTPGSYNPDVLYSGQADILTRDADGGSYNTSGESVISGGSGDYDVWMGGQHWSGTNTMNQILQNWKTGGSTTFSKGVYTKKDASTSVKPYLNLALSQKANVTDDFSLGYSIFGGTKYSPTGTGFTISAGHKKTDLTYGYKQKSGGGGVNTLSLTRFFGGKKKR